MCPKGLKLARLFRWRAYSRTTAVPNEVMTLDRNPNRVAIIAAPGTTTMYVYPQGDTAGPLIEVFAPFGNQRPNKLLIAEYGQLLLDKWAFVIAGAGVTVKLYDVTLEEEMP